MYIMENASQTPQDSKQFNPLLIVGFMVVLAGIAFASTRIMKQSQSAEQAAMKQVSPTTAPAVVDSGASPTDNVMAAEDTATDVKTIDIEAGSFYYKPNVLTVKKGQKVKIVIHSVSMMHDFNIDELGVKSAIVKNGDTGTVEFTPEKAGTFEYYCSVGQHRANGQVGKITVEE